MKIAVIGSGVMGPGIALTWMLGGYRAALADLNIKALEAGVDRIIKSISLMNEKNIVNKDAGRLLPLLSTTTSLEQAVEGAGLVIECVAERPDVKEELYNRLDRICPKDTVIVSNTSALPLPDMFPAFRPDRFFICHYFNPPEIIPLVELVRNVRTDGGAVDCLKKMLKECGKEPIVLTAYKPGFLVNRLQVAMMREAFHLVNSGIVQPEDIDTAIRSCIGFKSVWQGLFETMDYIGLDTVALACSVIFRDLSNDTDIPEVVAQKVREGNLGVKSGKGFFSYIGEEGEEILKRRQNLLLEQLSLWNKEML